MAKKTRLTTGRRERPRKRAEQQRSIATRASILDAAIEEFAEREFEGASIRAIADRLGLQHPLITYHYRSRTFSGERQRSMLSRRYGPSGTFRRRKALICGVPDQKYGEEICAWIVLKPGNDCTEDGIREFCRNQIAHYKVPRYIRFVEEMPMTVTGKAQKFMMRERMIEELKLNETKTA